MNLLSNYLISQNLFGRVQSPVSGRGFGLFENIIQTLVLWIISIGILITFVVIIIGGIRFITAQGSERAISSAKGMVVSGVVGLTMLLAIFLIFTLVDALFETNFVKGGLRVLVP